MYAVSRALMFGGPEKVPCESGRQTVVIDDLPWFRPNIRRRRFNIGEDHGIPERHFVELRGAGESFLQGPSNFVHSLLSLTERTPLEREGSP